VQAVEEVEQQGVSTALLPLWLVLGIGYSMVGTPTGRLLRRSAHAEDRPALFAAQFALSHACWLLTYPLAGWLGAEAGLPASFGVLAGIAAAAAGAAAWLWPAGDPDVVPHVHRDLARGHPYLAGAVTGADPRAIRLALRPDGRGLEAAEC